LIRLDLHSGAIAPLDNPNSSFAARSFPPGRVYLIPDTNGAAWGRLYLPRNYRRGTRYPLVFTQYLSSPGFAQSVGDEIPIAPLLEQGIAIFDMYSSGLGMQSSSGDFRHEVERLRRPLEGMKKIADLLDAEGIIDRSRIAVTGLSYGAEIAMYAYWNWPGLRTVSAAGGSIDPNVYYAGGPLYAEWLKRRGLPAPDIDGLSRWREISVALNARPGLPPLLLQTPDSEEMATVGTWTALRSKGVPVEWDEYFGEGHVKRRPATKWRVFERNLNWLSFWLTGRVTPSAALETDSLDRWRQMSVRR
jgi:dipeptidyl aminopeptidase/acylaminoacyl peptidase